LKLALRAAWDNRAVGTGERRRITSECFVGEQVFACDRALEDGCWMPCEVRLTRSSPGPEPSLRGASEIEVSFARVVALAIVAGCEGPA
jgi:hypothetical protein